MKKQIGVITTNFIGAVVGAGAIWYAAKKVGGVSNKWALVAVLIVGAAVGAHAQAAIKANSGASKSAGVAGGK